MIKNIKFLMLLTLVVGIKASPIKWALFGAGYDITKNAIDNIGKTIPLNSLADPTPGISKSIYLFYPDTTNNIVNVVFINNVWQYQIPMKNQIPPANQPKTALFGAFNDVTSKATAGTWVPLDSLADPAYGVSKSIYLFYQDLPFKKIDAQNKNNVWGFQIPTDTITTTVVAAPAPVPAPAPAPAPVPAPTTQASTSNTLSSQLAAALQKLDAERAANAAAYNPLNYSQSALSSSN